jgi:hypothetical protein
MFSAEADARPRFVSPFMGLESSFLAITLTESLLGSSRPDLIDSALLRPGRLDKSLLCDMPNRSDRKEVGFSVSFDECRLEP